MKKLLKTSIVAFLLIFTIVACNKDDDMPAPAAKELKSVSYKTKSIKGNLAKAFSSPEITLNPTSIKATFSITKITKDKKEFKNPSNGFKVGAKGKVFGANGHKLTAGTYSLTITAKNKSKSKNLKSTTLSVVISK